MNQSIICVVAAVTAFLLLSSTPGRCAEDEESGGLREPAVAGSFYPNDAKELRTQIEGYLQAADPPEVPGEIKVLLVPHAGYVFSAGTAAYSYKLLQTLDGIKTIILMGSPHRLPIRGVSIWPDGSYRTPLGEMAVAQEVAGRLMKSCEATFSATAHKMEHSLEVEVPFLQVVAPQAKLVPMLVQLKDTEQLERIAGVVAEELKRADTLLVISTDLSHYPTTGQIARLVDSITLSSIETLDPREILRVSAEQMQEGWENLQCTMCGQDAVLVAVMASEQLGINTVTRLHYSNSAAVAGEG
ncbi:MAG: AmmeMemoRadiSam system protein B, partial [Planctomycetes bacterium]|nr:AmmeMemoRadiSam system protein B [Planctomycetota bacterium]